MIDDQQDDFAPPPFSGDRLEGILPRSFFVLLDTFDENDYSIAYHKIESLLQITKTKRDNNE